MAFTIFLLAQAGVPLTTGFVAKFEVIGAAVAARSYWLAVVAMVSAVVSAFLYLRIVLSMYLGQSDEDRGPVTPSDRGRRWRSARRSCSRWASGSFPDRSTGSPTARSSPWCPE
ncbi:MAG: proton-conducting transporter membrane subunit [Acidimicrobiales bacterium]